MSAYDDDIDIIVRTRQLLFIAEAWTLLTLGAAALSTFKRKIIRKIFQIRIPMLARTCRLNRQTDRTKWVFNAKSYRASMKKTPFLVG